MTEAESKAKGTAWKHNMIYFAVVSPPASGSSGQSLRAARNHRYNLTWDWQLLHYWVNDLKERSRIVVQPLGTIVLPITEQHLNHDKPFEQPVAPFRTVHLPQTTPTSRETSQFPVCSCNPPPGCFRGCTGPSKSLFWFVLYCMCLSQSYFSTTSPLTSTSDLLSSSQWVSPNLILLHNCLVRDNITLQPSPLALSVESPKRRTGERGLALWKLQVGDLGFYLLSLLSKSLLFLLWTTSIQLWVFCQRNFSEALWSKTVSQAYILGDILNWAFINSKVFGKTFLKNSFAFSTISPVYSLLLNFLA